jgi:ubiquinone/menaquinone biosynthesis C-methylase UbiE
MKHRKSLGNDERSKAAAPSKGSLTPASDSHDVERFNKWAVTYDRSALQSLFFAPVHSRILRLLDRESDGKRPACLIDVGCGTGRLLAAASSLWPDAQLFGADPAERMVSEANRLRPSLTIALAAAESLPFPDESADMVVSSLSFHHWIDQGKGIEEIARVLRPGGLFCLADHTFLPAKLFGERPKSAGELTTFLELHGLSVKLRRRAGLPFILITLAQKVSHGG